MAKKQSPAKKSAKKSAAKKSLAKKSAAKKSAAKKSAVKKSAAKTSVAKKSATKKSAAKKSTGSTSVSRQPSPTNVANQINVKQSSEYMGNNWWKWSVWIDGPPAVLKDIQSVTYNLHSTFPDNVREQTNAAEKFRLSSEGWGEFTIHAEIKPRSGHKITKRHWLTLEYPSAPRAMSRGFKAAEDEEGSGATVFLSAGVSDLRLANALAEFLKTKRVKVLKSDDFAADLPWEVAIAGMIKAADLMVVIISGPPNSWITRQIDAARNQNVDILPIVIGSTSLVPENIQEFQTINVKDANEAQSAAPYVVTQILKKLKTLPPKTK